MSENYRLRLPGPTAVPERVREATARPVLSHRGPEFISMLGRTEEMMRTVLGTRNHVLFFASSGTGMMEASLVNVLAPGERVLVSTHGQFGDRFAAIATALGARVDTFETPWGQSLDAGRLEERLGQAEYRAFVVVHNESSTGVVAELKTIGAVLRSRPTLLVVDSVSGLGGVEVRQDEWGIDIVASASQKALMCPPGVGLISMSDKAWDVVKRDDRMSRYYWDFRKAQSAAERPETPFTTPVSQIAGVHEALSMMLEEGIPQVLARHQLVADALRAGSAALGLSSYPQSRMVSNTVVCLNVPGSLNGKDIVRRLKERFGTVIAGSRNKLENRVIRIGTMGHIHAEDILTDLAHLEAVLPEVGWPVEPGAGLAAAAKILEEKQTIDAR